MATVDGIRGLVATRDIAAGEAIVAIPLCAALQLSGASAPENDPSAPAVELLRLMRGERGDAAPYLDLIPQVGSPDVATMPDFYSDAELQSLQCPPVAAKTKRRQQLCAARAGEHGLAETDMQWALCTVAQRCFTILSPVDGLLRLLLPGVDFFNHDADSLHGLKVTWTLQPVYDGLFKVVAGSDIKKGEEVRICYGGNPNRPEGCGGDCHGDVAWTNDQYLQRYGFVDRSLGTTMVDGKWLVSEATAEIRDALAQSTLAEDEALLTDTSLTPAARTALEYRAHLKRALDAQQKSDALLAKEGAKAPSAGGEVVADSVAA